MTDHKKKGDFTGAAGKRDDSQGGDKKQNNAGQTPSRTTQNRGHGGR